MAQDGTAIFLIVRAIEKIQKYKNRVFLLLCQVPDGLGQSFHYIFAHNISFLLLPALKSIMGFYRLFLAMMVAISHLKIAIFGYNPGVVAVISFYLLSGYVMTMLIVKHYRRPSAIPTFYLDRAARLFPQFLFYMVLATCCILVLKVESEFTYKLTGAKWLLNFFLLPQAFYMYWGNGALVIPQTWSLGLEMTFYLVIPWILVYCSRKQFYYLTAVSFLVFLAAYLGFINTDYFGYRLLPGTLFIFLIGSSFISDNNGNRRFRMIMFILIALLMIIAIPNEKLYEPFYNREVLAGLLIGIVAVGLMRNLAFSEIDGFFGNLSYGVFLNHLIVYWTMQTAFSVTMFDLVHIVIYLIACCILAFFSYYLVERPAIRWRHTIRYRPGPI